MASLKIKIQEDKLLFFKELIASLDFVEIEDGDIKETHVYSNLKESVEEVNEIKKGNKKGISIKQLLDEI